MIDTSINNLNNLRILRASRVSGSKNGGDEIFLFCSYFDPSDILVEFIQFKQDTEISWRALASLDKTDIHGYCSLIVKTPKYLDTIKENSVNNKIETNDKDSTLKSFNISKSFHQNGAIKVYYRLFRPSTKEFSEKVAFYYLNDNFNENKELFGEKLLKESPLLKKIFTSSNNNNNNNNADTRKEMLQNEDLSLVKETLIKYLPENHHLKKKVDTNFKYFELIKKLLNLNIAKNTDLNENNQMITNDEAENVSDLVENLIENDETLLECFEMQTVNENKTSHSDKTCDQVPNKKAKTNVQNNDDVSM